ncbi:hypothetical protein MSG28_010870 [Choristoneura fumiferana]|uniref:Uncharacterized protein n=1 Tax=Choristoneura fumiferana TaxID=7141 RepID=A0ACC0KPW1_CHOFU|nr:hypothetical protein MSG28_010870 [Choristoneura fumiferana]
MKRVSRKVYANPEDAVKLGGKVTLNDPEVERVRRAHLNDLENIPAFWILGALYLTTNPAAAWATLLFRVYTLGRILHTVVYAIVPLPQPARALSYAVPYFIMWYMGFQSAPLRLFSRAVQNNKTRMALSLQSPVVQSYIVYSAILTLKLILLSALTGITRMVRRSFANPEDAVMFPKGKVTMNDPVVERIRRAHLNDLENIPAFWILGALYLTTNPAAAWATLLFRAYTLGRILHTIVYAIKPLPQPARGLAFFVPYLIKWYMGFQVIVYYLTGL